MTTPETFQEIKRLFGRMDDLCQQRKQAYTAWVGGAQEPATFVVTMRENLAATCEAAASLESLLGSK